MDKSTSLQAGQWLKNVSAKHVWDQLQACWINTYLGPPDFISSNAGTQFTAKKFKQLATNMSIIVKNMPVKAHHSIELVEHYHGSLRRVYTIIITEICEIKPDLALQISFKAFNNSVGSNRLVPTLLVFGAYFWMTEIDAPLSIITQYTTAMQKAIEEVRKLVASCQVHDALNTWNRPFTSIVYDLPLNSLVLVYREGDTGQSRSWKVPYKLFSLQGELAIVELPNGPTKFRCTLVKPYYEPVFSTIDTSIDLNENILPNLSNIPNPPNTSDQDTEENISTNDASSIANQDILPILVPVKCGCGRLRKYSIQVNLVTLASKIGFVLDNVDFDLLVTNDINFQLHQGKKKQQAYLKKRYSKSSARTMFSLMFVSSTHNLLMKSKTPVLIKLLKNHDWLYKPIMIWQKTLYWLNH